MQAAIWAFLYGTNPSVSSFNTSRFRPIRSSLVVNISSTKDPIRSGHGFPSRPGQDPKMVHPR